MVLKQLVSEEGLRLDGRRSEEFRTWDGLIGVVSSADGSAYLAQGQTKVLVTVVGPREGASESLKSAFLKPKVSVNVSWNTATFSDAEQRTRPRLVNQLQQFYHEQNNLQPKSVPDRRTISWIAALKDCLENVIIAKSLPNAHIDVHVNVLSSDGSVLACVTNALSLAIMDAGLPMLDVLCAVSVGSATLPSTSDTTSKIGRVHQMLTKEYTSIIDVSSQEESGYHLPVLTCAYLPKSNEMSFCHMEAKLSISELTGMIETAEKSTLEIQNRLKNIVIKKYS